MSWFNSALLIHSFVLGVLITSAAEAQSQPPVPGPPKVAQPDKHHAAGPQAKAEPDKRGTKSAPIVVETLESPADAVEKKASAKHREDEASRNGWMMVFTGGLLIIAIVQAGLFWYQLRLMRDATKEAAAAATAAKNSVELARQAFVATHRPEIVVQSIRSSFGPESSSDFSMKADVTIFNRGTTEAANLVFFGALIAANEFPLGLVVTNEISRAGAEYVLRAGMPLLFVIGGRFRQPEVPAEARVRCVCVGRIEYTDSEGHVRRTGFCRIMRRRGRDIIWDKSNDDEGYEYAY